MALRAGKTGNRRDDDYQIPSEWGRDQLDNALRRPLVRRESCLTRFFRQYIVQRLAGPSPGAGHQTKSPGSAGCTADRWAGDRENLLAAVKRTGSRHRSAAVVPGASAAWLNRTRDRPSSRPDRRYEGHLVLRRSYRTTGHHGAVKVAADGWPAAAEPHRLRYRYRQSAALSPPPAPVASRYAARQEHRPATLPGVGLRRGGKIVVEIQTKLRLIAPLMQMR